MLTIKNKSRAARELTGRQNFAPRGGGTGAWRTGSEVRGDKSHPEVKVIMALVCKICVYSQTPGGTCDPVTRVGPTRAGPQQKSSGPRQK